MFQQKYTLRISLDDIIEDRDLEQIVIENVRRCRQISGKEFQVIFWNRNLTEKVCKDFIKRNEKYLFEVNTKITKEFSRTWFLIYDKSRLDRSMWRYCWRGDILRGISEYLKIIVHIKGK